MIKGWADDDKNNGTACGSESKPTSCGSSCGSESKPTSCGSSCGANK